MSFVRVDDGIDLLVTECGSGDPVLIPFACWTDEYEVLATSHRVIRYDPRGRGGSSSVSLEQVSFEADLRDLEAIRTAMGLDRMALIGWSYFGGVTARYAMLNPERVSRLVLVGSTPVRAGSFMKAVEREQADRLQSVAPDMAAPEVVMQSADPVAVWDAFVKTRSGRKPPWPHMISRPFRYENEAPHRFFPLVTRAFETMGDWDWRMDARLITAPVLVVDGSADILPDQACAEWVQALVQGRAVVLEGVGHFPSIEDPERFFGVVAHFLAGGE